MDHKTARTRACAAGGWPGWRWGVAWTPFDHRVCDAIDPSTVDEPAVMHVISADTTVADTIRYDTPTHPVSVPIRYRSDNRPFSTYLLIGFYVLFQFLSVLVRLSWPALLTHTNIMTDWLMKC